MTMAVIVFVVGIGVSMMGFHTNNVAQAQETQVNKKIATSTAVATADDSTPPSTAPVTAKTVAAYQVAPDLPRYIKISKIGVNARVLQVGVTSSGALGTPTSVFDTAWYTGSAKPGEAGATLIDGHVSSWSSNGVFYNIKKLVAGDTITIQKGDGTLLTYSVVKTVAYDASNVDMQSLVQTAQVGKSGLNLITCGGKYDSKSGEFTQRIAVYAVLQ
jgi:LPXTG-site transpeptidase (sortase) family protein